MTSLLKLKNLTAFEATLIKAWFCACIFMIGACMTMLGQTMRIQELESHVASLKDEVVNAEAINNVN